MSSSEWGHGLTCCSNECGYAIGEQIKKIEKKVTRNEKTKQFRRAEKQLEKAQASLNRAKYQGLSKDEIQIAERNNQPFNRSIF